MGQTFSNQQRVIRTRSQLDEEIDLFRQDQLISSFLEIAVGQTTETARRFLQTTDWNINEAINLYLTNNNSDSSMCHDNQVQDSRFRLEDSDSRLYPSFSPPLYLLQESSFEDAKSVSIENNLWLIVNLQSRTELASHTLNRDVWSNDAVSQTVESNFNLWQVYDNSTEGQKISSFYKIDYAPPVVLVIDPITGQKMQLWSGVIEADSFVEDLMKFTEAGPHEHIASLTRNRRRETTETCLSGNNTYQPPAPSWGEEFETEDTWSSSNNNNQVVAPSWEQEFEDQDAWETWSSRNRRRETTETCFSGNNAYQPPAPSWGEEFEKEDTWSSRNNNNQVVAPSWEQEFEDQDAWETWSSRNRRRETTETCFSGNNAYQPPAPSWGEEFEKEDTWSSRNNNNQVVTPSWEQEFEDQDAWETWSSRSDSDDFVPPFIGDEYEESDEVEEDEACLEFPVLTDEPKGDCDPSVVCGLCVRFPDGRRKQRKFLKSEPIQLLWSFCYSHMDESDKNAFKLVQAIPGASKTLDYGANATFDQSGLANSLISVTWE